MQPVPQDPADEFERRIADLQQKHLRPDLPAAARHALNGHARDPEIESLANLAEQLQAAPELRPDAAFARRLEKRVLAHNAAQHRRSAPRWWGQFLPRPLRARPALGLALSLCILFLLVGGGVLVAAAQIDNPNNPLYSVKRWEQQAQVSLASSPADQAELHLKFARDQLQSLGSFANAAQAPAYRQTLDDFHQQLDMAAQDITALPAGQDHDRLTNELTTLQATARQTLRGLLGQLTVPEQLLTTDELGHLGAAVPSLAQATVTLPAHPNGQATVSVSGTNLQPGAELLVDDRTMAASGTLQNGVYLFTATWTGNQHPHSIGIVNPDGTAAQTTNVSIKTSSDNGNGNGKGGGNGGNGTKPTPR